MIEATRFSIGAEASCIDGICGEVSGVVIDPVAETVTHLMVQPKHRRGMSRLVPVELLDTTTGEVRLRCSTAEFDNLDPAEETHFVSGGDGYAGYAEGQAFMWPYYGLGGRMGVEAGGGLSTGASVRQDGGSIAELVTTDTVPVGEIAVNRGDQVLAIDGAIGRVQGLVIMPADHHITHVLLQEGHLFGRKKVAIPISVVTGVAEGIQLSLTKQQVQDLPPVDFAHLNG